MEAAYLAGAAAARTGDEASGPALLLLGTAATGSATTGAALLAGLTVSAAIGGPVIGVLLDRCARPGRLLAGALAAYAAGIAACAALLGRVPLPVVVAVAVATGALGPVLSAGWTSQLPRVFAPGASARGTTLDAMTFSLAGLVGPALAGLLASAAGASVGVAAAAGLIALAALAAPALPDAAAPRAVPRAPHPPGSARTAAGDPEAGTGSGRTDAGAAADGPIRGRAGADEAGRGSRETAGPGGPAAPRRRAWRVAMRGWSRRPARGAGRGAGDGPGGAPERVRPDQSARPPAPPEVRRPETGAGGRPRGADVVAGMRAIVREPALLRATAVSSVSLAASGMFVVCTPVLGARLLGGAENGVVLLSLMALCALCANAVLAGRPAPVRPDTVLVVCVLAQAVGTAVAAVAPGAAPLVAAVAVIGVAEGPQLTALFAIRHREAPDRLRAQVFTTGASLKITAFAAGSALAGPLADLSPTLCLATAAAVHAAAGLLHALLGTRGRPEGGAPCGRRSVTGTGWRRCGPRSG